MSDIKISSEIELLTFQLENHEYALDIMSVREIRGWTEATPLPHAPDYMKGVINLRGTVLPVMDLAIRLGLPGSAHTARNVIVVVKHAEVMTGLLVDAVSDIISLANDDLHAPPETTESATGNVISSLTIREERMIRILDLGAIIALQKKAAA